MNIAGVRGEMKMDTFSLVKGHVPLNGPGTYGIEVFLEEE